MSTSIENRSPGMEILKAISRIMKSHSVHFHSLSILFLFPIVFTLLVYPSFHLALFHPDYDFTLLQSHISLSSFEIIVFLMLTLFLALFSICAVATITHSAFQALHDRPINLVSSIKSIRNSFFPLLSTLIISHTIFISIALLYVLVFVFVVQILHSLGLIELKYDLNHLLFLVIFSLIVLVPILLWLQVNWSIAYVIAVVESKCGFETLRRSAYLVKGKRWVAFSTMLSYELVMGMMVVCSSIFLVVVGAAAKGNQWRSLVVILQTAQFSVLGFLMMNHYLVGNVALYMYSKDVNGEKSRLEIGDKFTSASKYVSMPSDDEKNHAIV